MDERLRDADPRRPPGGLDEVTFGPFRLVPAQRLLLENGAPVVLGGRALDILIALVSRPGELLSKMELLDLVWPGVFVAEGTLRVHVAGLRTALGDGRGGRRFIATTAGRGYSFVAPVSREGGAATTPVDTKEIPRPPEPPILATEVFGREDEVADVSAQVLQRRLVTLTGLGGVGKTTVALAATQALRSSFPAGVCFVDLTPLSNPGLVLSTLASALSLTLSPGEPLPALIRALGAQRLLIVLDNCEHVVTAAAALAGAILRGAPNVHILATSREPLRAQGEHVRRLQPLDLPADQQLPDDSAILASPAVKMFMARVEASGAYPVVFNTDVVAISDICRRLDGLPLAIELAAARVGTLGVRGVAARLSDRFSLLTGGYRTSPLQHQTLEATYDWSYQLLSPDAQNLLRCLGVFASDFSTQMAEDVFLQLGSDPSTFLDAFAEVTSTSLASQGLQREDATYRLLESTRTYARAKLAAEGDPDIVFRSHAITFLNHVNRVGEAVTRQSTAASAELFRELLDDLRVALDWAFSEAGDERLGVRLTIATAPLWAYLSLHEECRWRSATALEVLRKRGLGADADAMKLQAMLGTVLAYSSSVEAREAWKASLQVAQRNGNVEYQHRALRGLWTSNFSAGHLQEAVSILKNYAEVPGGLASLDDKSHWVRMRGMTRFYVGDFSGAQEDLESALDAYDQSQDLDLVRFQFDQRALVCVSLATTLWIKGDIERAISTAQLSLDYATRSEHDLSVVYALAYITCRMALLTGDLARAKDAVDQLFGRAMIHPLPLWDVIGRCWQGVLLARKGEFQAAADILGQALAVVPEGSFSLHSGMFRGEYAYAVASAGDPQRGLSLIDEPIRLCERLDERWCLPELLRLKGEILLREGASSVREAEVAFEAARTQARHLGALSWELRSTASLAKVWRADGRETHAKTMLTDVYSRFRDGWSTADLRLAKALIDEL